MKSKTLFWLLITTLLLIASPAWAQQTKKVNRIGFLLSRGEIGPNQEAFRQRLRELGYTEGENLIIEWRFTKGSADRLPNLASDLVRLNVDVIVAVGTLAIQAAKQATSTIPIIFPIAGDPVASGLVASLARPGGNVTGMSLLAPELSGKRLDLLKEIVPRLTRVAVLLDPRQPQESFKVTQTAAQTLRLTLQSLQVREAKDIESGFATISRERTDALIALEHPYVAVHQRRILELAAKSRLPGFYPNTDWVEAGGLLSYGPDFRNNYQRAAIYVDKILKGAKPADLPVEQPTKFELAINLKTAKQIGLTIPQSVLYRADRVIR